MTESAFVIRPAQVDDFPAIWSIFEPVVLAGDTYAIPTNISFRDARKLWLESPLATYVASEGDVVLGTFYLKPNQAGGGGHVCNCGYMVAETARGRGLATAMCNYSQQEALRLGFKAMQFNLVLSTNSAAVALWEKLGFDIVGTLPRAFDHPQQGLVDAFVMYKWLSDD